MRIGGLLTLLWLAAVPAFAAEPIRIGDINSYFTIPAFTEPYRNGWQLAVEEINGAGGVLGGRLLEVISRDDGGLPDQAAAAAEDLVNRTGAVILSGTMLSQTGLAVADFARRRKVPFLAAQPLSDDLVWSRGNRFTFRLTAGTYTQAAILAEQAAKLPARRWATVAPDYDQGRALVTTFRLLLKARRADVVFVAEEWPPLGALDASASVAALAQSKPQAIFNATFGGDLARLAGEGLRQGLFPETPVVSAQTGDPECLDMLGADAPKGWIVTGYPWYALDAPEHRRFVDAYLARFNEDPRMAALLGYVAVKAIAAAVIRAGGTGQDALLAAFDNLTVASPAGPVTFRGIDHQSTLGTWVGKTAVEDG
ncbi:MAG TPA: ABC transporter substrate-binding protein, partial [Rhodospirillaceae bacterium]|nr:ABC transporter substrate-binding protein [Rhodospirillaceae bacterium]